MVKVLAEMQPDERFRKPAALPYASDVAEDVQADLRYHDLAGFTGGGIIHSHMGATDVNRYVLARLGLGSIITVRHPADHIAALYCHIRGLLSARDKAEIIDTATTPPTAREDYVDESKPSQLYYHGVIFPVDPRFFGLEASVDDAITHLIAGGYLFHALSWIVSWQLFRVRNISMIIRYEDFLSEPQELIQRINTSLTITLMRRRAESRQ